MPSTTEPPTDEADSYGRTDKELIADHSNWRDAQLRNSGRWGVVFLLGTAGAFYASFHHFQPTGELATLPPVLGVGGVLMVLCSILTLLGKSYTAPSRRDYGL